MWAPESSLEPVRNAHLPSESVCDTDHDTAVDNLPVCYGELVECKFTPGIDVCHNGAVVQGHLIAKSNQVRLCHQSRPTTGPDRTILSDLGSECSIEPDDVG